MAEIVKVEPLEDGGTLEYYDDGAIRAKDSQGVFMKHPKNFVPSQAASDIKAGRTKRYSKKTMDQVEELMEMLPSEILADPRREWLIRQEAAQLVSGTNVTATLIAHFVKSIGLGHLHDDGGDSGYIKLKEGEKCPHCGQYFIPFAVDSASAAFVLAALNLYEVSDKKAQNGA